MLTVDNERRPLVDRRASFPIFVRSVGYRLRRLALAPHAGRLTPLADPLAGPFTHEGLVAHEAPPVLLLVLTLRFQFTL